MAQMTMFLLLCTCTFVYTQKLMSKIELLQIDGEVMDDHLSGSLPLTSSLHDRFTSAISGFMTQDDMPYCSWIETYYFHTYPKLSYMALFMDIIDTGKTRLVQDENMEYIEIEFNFIYINNYINAIRLFYTSSCHINDLINIKLGTTSINTHGNLMITSLETEIDTFALVQDRIKSRIDNFYDVQQQSFVYIYAQALSDDIDIIRNHILPFLCQEVSAADTATIISNKIHEIYSKNTGERQSSSKARDLVYEYVTSSYLQELVVFLSSTPYEVTCKNEFLYTKLSHIAYDTNTTFNGNNVTLFISIKDVYSFYYNQIMTYRHIYSLPSRLYYDNNDKLITRLLGYNGEGSFSTIFFNCMNKTATIITSECQPVRVRLAPYNNVIATLGMTLLPTTVYTGIGLPPREENETMTYNQNLCEGKRSRVLIGGLGGGEMHQFLLKHHPCLYVDSVEINEDVMITAQQHLGLEGQICNLHRLPSLKSSNTYDTFDPSCRSTVIIGDIFEYVQHLTSVSPYPLYDFIITDIYDENTVLYDGSNKTSSNANVHSGIQTLAQLQSVLKPENGIVFFHLHYDIQYEKYEAAIMQAFQESGEVFKLTPTFNSRVLVASNFLHQYHPCRNNRLQFAQDSIKLGIRSSYPLHITYAHVFSYLC